MPGKSFSLQTNDGLSLMAYEWYPQTSPAGVIVLVHGMGEHSGRYEQVAQTFIRSGYIFVSFDLRGHGQSQGQKGHTPSYDSLMEDIELSLRHEQKEYPELPLYLYGHSLGGNLVLNFALRRSFDLRGVIVTSPWLRLAFEPPKAKVKLAGLLDRIWPSFSQANELSIASLAHDQTVSEAYRKDPLVHNLISVRLFKSVYAAGYWAVENASNFSYPLLLMHGDEDKITSWKASKEFAEQIPGQCTFKLWPGLYHELHNETKGPEILEFIMAWIGRVSP